MSIEEFEEEGLYYGPFPNGYEPPRCTECNVICVIPHGEVRVYHHGWCEIGKAKEARRDALREQLSKLRSDYDHEEGTWTMVDKRIKGHEEIVIATGYHNPRDSGDWCYLIRCKCGAKDIAWTHEDARQAARQHRIDVRTPAPTAPAKAPRGNGAVPSTQKPARQRTTQTGKQPRRVLY